MPMSDCAGGRRCSSGSATEMGKGRSGWAVAPPAIGARSRIFGSVSKARAVSGSAADDRQVVRQLGGCPANYSNAAADIGVEDCFDLGTCVRVGEHHLYLQIGR